MKAQISKMDRLGAIISIEDNVDISNWKEVLARVSSIAAKKPDNEGRPLDQDGQTVIGRIVVEVNGNPVEYQSSVVGLPIEQFRKSNRKGNWWKWTYFFPAAMTSDQRKRQLASV